MSEFRLDYISNFKEGTTQKMADIRSKFVALEDEILELKRSMVLEGMLCNTININRCFDESLSHLERSQMYAIKMLCLLGEEGE